MHTTRTHNLKCFERINALGTGRFLRSEAQYWLLRSSHLQILFAISVMLILIILVTEGFESNSKFITFLGILTAWNLGILNARNSASDCYIEGYRQGYIDGVVKHWEPLLLDTDVQEKYLNTRLKEFETSYLEADEKFINSQEAYLLKGQTKARTLFSKKFRQPLS